MSPTLIVLTTLPDEGTARTLAHELITRRLAACVQILPPSHSVYRWEDKVEEEIEIPLQIKTCAARYAELEALLLAEHPYEVPEIIALPITNGLPAYLDWVRAESAPD